MWVQFCSYCCLCCCSVISTGAITESCGGCIAFTFVLSLLGLGFSLYKTELYPDFMVLEDETLTSITELTTSTDGSSWFSLSTPETGPGIVWQWFVLTLSLAVLIDLTRKCMRSYVSFYYLKLVVAYYLFKYAFYLLRGLEAFIGGYTFAAERYFVYLVLLLAMGMEVNWGWFVRRFTVLQGVLLGLHGAVWMAGGLDLDGSTVFDFMFWRLLIPGVILFLKYGSSAFVFGWISAISSMQIDHYRYTFQPKATTEEHINVYAFETLLMLGAIFGLLAVAKLFMLVLYFVFGEVPWAAGIWFDGEIAYVCSYLHYWTRGDQEFATMMSDFVAVFLSVNAIRLLVSVVF